MNALLSRERIMICGEMQILYSEKMNVNVGVLIGLNSGMKFSWLMVDTFVIVVEKQSHCFYQLTMLTMMVQNIADNWVIIVAMARGHQVELGSG